VRGLQGAFIRRLGGVEYAAERDGDAYTEMARQAVRCYAALPEDS
jgi:hypothetical protein